MRNREVIVWLPVEQTYGYLVELGAFFSTVKYTKDGVDFEILMENNEFEFLEDTLVEYDDDDDD